MAQSRQPSNDRDPLASAEAALAAAQAQYSDTHPDVIAARERVKQLRQIMGSVRPDTTLQEQIAANNAAIRQLMDQRDSTVARANAAVAGSARAPAIMEQSMQLEVPLIGLVPLLKAAAQRRSRRLRGFLSREKRLAA